MINNLLQVIAPHHCYGCGKTGAILCENCKYDIEQDSIDACIMCMTPSQPGICKRCETSYSRAWFVGERTDALHDVIDALKFDRVIDAADTIASLLDARLPVLPASTVLVPVPTIRSHVRQRGYDHTLRIAKRLAKLRGLRIEQIIVRYNQRPQRGLSKKERLKQASETFFICGDIDQTVNYLVVDDVVTTNATLRYCAEALREAGASDVWVAVAARQPLDKDTGR
jgi:ComF family protein